MRFGVWMLSLFAAIWGVAALAALKAPGWAWLAPPAISVGVVVLCRRVGASAAGTPGDGRRVGRLVGLWSAVEGIAIVLAINMLLKVGAVRLAGPAVGVIVGLHFLPLASEVSPCRLYYVTGTALIGVGVAAMFLPDPYPLAATGAGAAVILWLSSAALALLPPAARAAPRSGVR